MKMTKADKKVKKVMGEYRQIFAAARYAHG
jgi:hypothetical protein